jgi:hypothetical protein
MGLVTFDLQEIISPFFGDGPGDLALAVQLGPVIICF